MKKMKYTLILLCCTPSRLLHPTHIRSEIPATNLQISDKTIQEYLSDTMEEKNERNIEDRKKKSAALQAFSLFKRVKTLFLICKDYLDLQYTLLKEYVADTFKNV